MTSLLFVMPPSETKRSGGEPESTLDFDALSFPTLGRVRRSVAATVVRLSRDADEAARLLKISPALAVTEVARNRTLKISPTMPALERYTGVAFDPIDAPSLAVEARDWAREHVAVHSALFGLVRAADPIPAYRLSHDTRLPEKSLKSLWAGPVARALASSGQTVIDLRSEGYSELGPAPLGSAYVRVVSDEGGRRRALNHFNKKTKGTLIARLLAARPDLATVEDFVGWARGEGMVVEPHGGELVVVAESVLRS
ncbi:hypothetical protein EDF46_0658 [Frondihabitans sp. PhB188]|uniref:YaaA family protein n=1 Tax=Frondihabitans sp. PhB188 TaxID=2485200 RepID=UPI000F91075B|nr:hypothetical protein EDF46_0658 [Frondihabitans sp. PhB188]